MIRTRDLAIFVGVLFFVLFGITVTLLKDARFVSNDFSFGFGSTTPEETLFVAQKETRTIDRDDIITRLRAVLSQNDTEVIPSPSVEEEGVRANEDTAVPQTNEVFYCEQYDDSQQVARSWPLEGVSVVASGVARNVVHTERAEAFALKASSTASSTVSSQVLMSMPLTPLVSLSEQCVPGEVVGITVQGSLIHNAEAAFYRGYGAEYLIGYARDGFPIYGYYEGEVDACGGYLHAQGYRYTVSKDRDYLLGCYRGTPSAFVGF